MKAQCGLKISSRKFSLCFGDTLRDMVFTPSRVDLGLWMKLSPHNLGHAYAGTFFYDIIVTSKELPQHLDTLAHKFNFINATESPRFFLALTGEMIKIMLESQMSLTLRNT